MWLYKVRKLFRNKDCAECFLMQNSPEKALHCHHYHTHRIFPVGVWEENEMGFPELLQPILQPLKRAFYEKPKQHRSGPKGRLWLDRDGNHEELWAEQPPRLHLHLDQLWNREEPCVVWCRSGFPFRCISMSTSGRKLVAMCLHIHIILFVFTYFYFHLYFSLLPGKPRLQLPSDLGSVLPDVPRYLLLHRPGQHPDQDQCKTEVRLWVPTIILGFGTVHLHG